MPKRDIFNRPLVRAGGVAIPPAVARSVAPPKLPTLVGYGSVFYNSADPKGTQYTLLSDEEGDVLERIDPHAFDRALRERQDTVALMNHDRNLVVGRVSAGTLRLSVDSKGLRYEIDPPNSPLGESVAEAVRSRSLTGSSFAFAATDASWGREGNNIVRTIRDVQLYDVGPVTYPAYSGATASCVETGTARSAPPVAPRSLDYLAAIARARQVELELELARAGL